MSTIAAAPAFTDANPHALAGILEAAETRRIIASTDIFDIQGIKLWARDMPVSSALQRKLMDRSLRKPLETCLVAEDGVTSAALCEALRAGSTALGITMKHTPCSLANPNGVPSIVVGW